MSRVESTNNESKTTTLVRNLKDLALETTTHGLSRIVSRPLIFKIMWSVFILVSFSVCLFMLVGNFQNYFTFDVNTMIRVVPQRTLTLPAITICNLNPFITSTAQAYIATYYKIAYNVTLTNYKQFRSLIDSKKIPDDTAWLLYDTYNPTFDKSLRDAFGFSFNEQALWCKQKYHDCDHRLFREIYHAKFGKCLIYNSGITSDGRAIELIETSDEEYGLDMAIFTGSLYINESSYFYEPSNKGIVLIVQDQKTISFEKKGVLIEPGTYANVMLAITNTTKLPLPYNNCLEKRTIDTILVNEMNRLNMTYDRGSCFTLCRQKEIIEKLNCYDMRYPRLFNATPCNTRELFYRLEAVELNLEECQAQCPFDCNSLTYDWSSSFGSFPNYYSFKIINKTNYDFLSNYYENGSFTYSDLRKSVAGFFVYYDPMSVTVISQTPSVPFADLVSNSGGLLGVFLGLSLLSIVELIELSFLILIFVYQNYLKGPTIDLKSKIKKKDDDVKEFWIRWKDELKRCGKLSKIHGISKMALSKNYFIKFFWLLCFLISLGFCVYMIVRLILMYKQFNLKSSIRQQSESVIKFPSIFICNPNYMHPTTEATEYLSHLHDMESKNSNFFYIENLRWFQYLMFAPEFNKTSRQSLGLYSLHDRIIRCEFNYKPCNLSWFDMYSNPLFGECFQFNTGKLDGVPNSVDILTIDKSGAGLYLELFTGLSDELYANLLYQWHYNAMHIFIADQSHLPLDKYGRLIRPGVAASISMMSTHYQNRPTPYTECQYTDLIDNDLVWHMRRANMSYDRYNCISLCQEYLIVNQSNCYDVKSYSNIFDFKLCRTFEEYNSQINPATDNFETCLELCPPECEQFAYDVEISYSDFPTRNYANKLIHDRYDFYTSIFKTENITYEMFKKSVTSMNFYFKDMEIVEINESPSVEMVDLISNIGGTVSLFIGFSVVTSVELIEIAINSALLIARYGFKKTIKFGF